MNRETEAILFRDNPWLEDAGHLRAWLDGAATVPWVERSAEASAARWRDPRRAHLVIGPRQCGKSSLIRHWLAEEGEPALVLDCEQALVRSLCRSAPLFLDALEGITERAPILVLEEAQHLEEAGLFVKGLIDRRHPEPVLVTGSSSWQLGARTRESLAGRATRTLLLPFSLRELTADSRSRPSTVARRAAARAFERHVRYGGFPDVWSSDDPALRLTELVEAFVIRDASDLFRIDRPDAFRGLLHLAARQVGSLVNLSEWGALLGLNHATVSTYLGILEESHVLRLVRPFAGGKRSELTSRPKAFFLDPGVRNHLVGDLRPLDDRADAGATLEGWVFAELAKTVPMDRTIHFWRSTSGAEVDFVVRGPTGIVAVEVKAGSLSRPRLPRATRSFIDAYQPELTLLVNRGYEGRAEVSGRPVRWLHPEDLATALAGTVAVPG